MNRFSIRALLVAPALVVAACNGDAPFLPSAPQPSGAAQSSRSEGPSSYVIDFVDAIPASAAADVESVGGTLTTRLEDVGIAFATSSDPQFRARARALPGVRSVSPDLVVQWVPPHASGEIVADAGSVAGQATGIGSTETYRAIQWNVDAISAPAAWDAGYLGQGVRVAVIDGGIYDAHVDLRNRIDRSRSTSFVPGFAYNEDVGTFWHGTHVAGIVAAEAQGIGTIGVAPEATIVGVKALHNGSGAFSWLIHALYYAATPVERGGGGANVINMSLGAVLIDSEEGVEDLRIALDKATTFAFEHGVTVISSAGNDAHDIHNTPDRIWLPAQSAKVIAVSATGPIGFGKGATNFDAPASYSNFGQGWVDFSGPGGNDEYRPLTETCTFALNPTGTSSIPCYALDFVIAPCRGAVTSTTAYCWSEGTSMAAPAVSGVAALIVGKYGPIAPSAVESILERSADDLGPEGDDPFYGRGRVNAFRAVQ